MLNVKQINMIKSAMNHYKKKHDLTLDDKSIYDDIVNKLDKLENCNYNALIVVSGNPADGMTFYGIFDDPEQANNWAESEMKDDDWWVVPLDFILFHW